MGKTYVVDQMCGSGKTTAAINMINYSSPKEKFIYVTPFLNEVARIKYECKVKKFKEPNSPVKIFSLKNLINRGENIVTTHSLFHQFDQTVIDLITNQNYTLILDEVADVIQTYIISKQDRMTLFEKYLEEPERGKPLRWRESEQDYEGKFEDVKRDIEMESLAIYGRDIIVWMFPIRIFKAFKKTYILTYMFNGQMQKYYYDYHKVEYEYLYVNNFRLFTKQKPEPQTNKLSSLLIILEDEKLNRIGEENGALSKSWYDRNKDTILMKQLKNNTYNFFRNRNRQFASRDFLWTTFKDYKYKLKGEGYTKGFLSHNARATNDFSDRIVVAYLINKYLNPVIKQFFNDNHIEVDEDMYALSEMIQFIWRSAIRDDEPIYVYVPSKRMRDLLKKYVDGYFLT